jgi:hypothetical protein
MSRNMIFVILVFQVAFGALSCKKAAPPPPEPLAATWVARGTSAQALSGQIMISTIESNEAWASLRLTLPDGTSEEFDQMGVGTRKVVEIDGVPFLLDLLDAGPHMGAEVALTPREQ